MAIELVHSDPSPEVKTRITRMLMDVKEFSLLTRAQARVIATDLERVRDGLSKILDRVK